MYRRKNDLQMLVDSFSTEERRDFKSMHKIDGKVKPFYMQLFYALISGKKVAAGGTSPQSMVIARRTLYQALLKHLRSGYRRRGASELETRMLDIAVLYERGLPEQCLRLLPKAKEMAMRQEQFSVWMQALEWESRLNALLDKPCRKIESITSEMKQVAALQHHILELEGLYHKIMEYKRTYGIAFGKVKERIEEDIIRHPALADETQCRSGRARYFFYHTKAVCYFMRQEQDAAYKESSRLVTLDPATVPSHDYINGLLFHCTTCISFGHFSETLRCLRKAEEALAQEPFGGMNILALKLFYYRSNYEVSCCLYMGRQEHLAQQLQTIEEKLEVFSERLPVEMMQVITAALRNGYMALGQHNKVEYYMDRILQYDVRLLRGDVMSHHFIFRLIWLLYAGMYAVIPSVALSTLRHFSGAHNKDNRHELGLALCRLLKKEYDYSDSYQWRQVVSAMKELLEKHIAGIGPMRHYAESYSCYAIWLDSMLNGTSYMTQAQQWYQGFASQFASILQEGVS